MILSFGDSHSREAEQVPGVAVAYIGPVTLHRFGRPGEAVNLFRPWSGAADGVFIMLGEIDVRCHIHQQVQTRSTREVIDELATGAAQGVAAIESEFKIPVVFCAITPPTRVAPDDPQFPVRGTIHERTLWTYLLNETLNRRVLFYDPYVDFRVYGMLPEHLSDGTIHLNATHGLHAFGPLVEGILSEDFR